MRRVGPCCAGKLVDADASLPLPVEAVPVTAACQLVLLAHPDGQPLMDVDVDLAELLGGVTPPKVVPPPSQPAVDRPDHEGEVLPGRVVPGELADLGADRGHGPIRGPSMQIPTTPPLPRLHHVMVKPEKVETALPRDRQVIR